MNRLDRRAPIWAASLLLVAAAAGADEPPQAVIAPGQEKLLSKMLDNDGKPWPGECKLDEASIEKSFVRVDFLCGADKKKQSFELRNPSEAKAPKEKTASFALVGDAPAPLLKSVAERIRQNEAGFVWTTAAKTSEKSDGGAGDDKSADAQRAEYERGLALYREKKFPEAFELFTKMARENAHMRGLLGMVVASLASQMPSRERVDKLGAEADADAKDPLKQFLAGVGAHYYAHQSAPSLDVKATYYRKALHYLEPIQQTYGFEPREYIYLAVSNFRLGNQKQAETLIEKAVALGTDDPDAYYCRAEIFQRANVGRSLEDLDRYIAMQKENEKRSGITSPEKTERVLRMRDHLKAVSEGKAQATEIWDPVTGQNAVALPGPGDKGNGQSAQGGADQNGDKDEADAAGGMQGIYWAALGLVPLLGIGVVLFRRRRPRS